MRKSLLVLALVLLAIASTSFAGKSEWNYSAAELASFAAIWERSIANGHVVAIDDALELGYFEGFVTGVSLA